jgi:hypothetical protein
MEEEDYSLKQGRRSPSRLAAGQDWPFSSLLRPATGLSFIGQQVHPPYLIFLNM